MTDMLTAAQKIRDKAYVPYSHFHVGCCIKTPSGNFYTGCNVENVSYGLTICAEASAITAMVSAGETQIQELVVVSNGEEICTPCGACRQRIREFVASPNTLIHMYNQSGQKKLTVSFKELLPYAFGPSQLESSSDFESNCTGEKSYE